MSYPGVDPADAGQTNPVGTQEAPAGVTMVQEPPVQPPMPSDAELRAQAAKAVEELFSVRDDAWGPKKVVRFKIECPSGQVALVKYLDTLDLVEYDLVEELDFFTRKLFPADIDASGSPVEAQEKVEESIWTALREPEKRRRFLEMTGKLMAAASVKPKIVHDGVVLVTDEKGEKTTRFGYQLSLQEQLDHFKKPIPALPDNAVYSGYIDFADRMAFFQELNKPLAVIEPFREGSAAVLQDMARVEGSGGETQ